MKNTDTHGAQALSRSLTLLQAVIKDDGQTPVSKISAQLGLAASSSRRMIATLEQHGMVERVARGRYAAGSHLLDLAKNAHPHRRLIEAARPFLHRLATQNGWTAHLGILNGDMVTYLIKEGGSDIFSREGTELEAYCTGIGKTLLSQLPERRLEIYLKEPFIPMTPYTICDPDLLREEIQKTAQRGYGIDDREILDTIACVAVPLQFGHNGLAGISLSSKADKFPLHQAPKIAERLTRVAKEISNRLK